jgi:signal transduction histidine kinase
MKLSTKLFLGFAIILLLFVVNSVASFKLTEKVNRNTDWLARSESIIRNSRSLQGLIVDMENGFRGYLLTGEESFFQPYVSAFSEIPPIYGELDSLVAEPVQKERISRIKALHGKWIKYAKPVIDARRTANDSSVYTTAQKYLLENNLKREVGKMIIDEIRLLFREFNIYELNVRQERRSELKQSIFITHATTISLTVLSILSGLAFALYITRYLTSRISTMVQLAESISEGNFKSVLKDREKDELTKLSRSLNKMAMTLDKNFTELERKNNELDQYAYVVSHDLKAPLRGIDNVTRWIEEDAGGSMPAPLKKYVDMMKGRVHRLENLINGLLELARIGRVKKTVEKVDINDLLAEIIDILSPPPGFKIETKGRMPVLYTEKVRLEQVFTNLIANSVKYHHRPDGQVLISCRDLGTVYEFSVKDDGPGIDPEYHERIFVIFQTLKERDAIESTGVGLSIVKKIVEDQKGTIMVKSEPGKGATFIFTWPKKALMQ